MMYEVQIDASMYKCRQIKIFNVLDTKIPRDILTMQ